jgi:hypothetical protein
MGRYWYVVVLVLNKIGLDLALAESGSIKMWKGCVPNMYNLAKINNVRLAGIIENFICTEPT